MMGYTKWIAVLLCLLGMTACRQDAPRFRIGVAQCSDDSWRHKMNDEILREAMFYDGVSVEIRSAADDNRKQAEDVHYFIDEGVDLLIISANEAAPMTPIVEEAEILKELEPSPPVPTISSTSRLWRSLIQ